MLTDLERLTAVKYCYSNDSIVQLYHVYVNMYVCCMIIICMMYNIMYNSYSAFAEDTPQKQHY